MYDIGWTGPVDQYDSADPLLHILRTDPSAVFGRPYAGYLIFLFGSADAAVAEWIRSNLVALDSLTGSDVAGVIFAKRIAINVQGSRRPSEDVSIQDIHYRRPPDIGTGKLSPLIHGSGAPAELSITAITRATDEVARSLGVMDELPCVVVMDATPSSTFDVIPITPETQDDLIPLLRDGLTRFRKQAQSKELINDLQKLQKLGPEIERLNELEVAANVERKTQTHRIDTSVLNCLDAAKQYLMIGSARLFVHTLRRIGPPFEEAALRASERAHVHSVRLCELAQTITSISRALRPEVSPSDREVRLKRIFARAANFITAEHAGELGNATSSLKSLRQELNLVVSVIWGDLPDLGQLQARYDLSMMEIDRNLRERLTILHEQRASLLTAVRTTMSELQRRNVSFRGCMLDARAARRIDRRYRPMSERALDLVLSFLRPSIRGDIYIGVNVGAMGRNASATNVEFRQGAAKEDRNVG